MKKRKILGRENEVARLNQCMDEEEAQLIIVCGRRRVGETYLINTYFDGRFDFKLTGVNRESIDVQLRNFTAELNRQTKQSHIQPKDWIQAFEMLREYLSSLPKDEKRIIFLDEMPWLDTAKSNFLSAFEFFWNDFCSAEPNLMVIICGSVTSWMQKKIIQNKGGLFDRQSCTLHLKPFTLREIEMYLKEKGIEWERYDIARCYMILGGVPFYWSLLRSDYTLAENIDNLFFRKRAELWAEYEHLYETLFTNSEICKQVMEILGTKRGGMTRTELAKALGAKDNNSLTNVLEDLVASEFIRVAPFFGNKKKEARYQISDYYMIFYNRFIRNCEGRDEHYWTNAYDNPSRRVWEGSSYETLCKDHLNQIRQKLSIGGVLSESSTWFIRPDPEDPESKGTQIDLLIDRRDYVINICEIKFSMDEFEIDKDYAASIRSRIETFQRKSKTKKTLQLTMITTFGIKRNKYSGMVNSEVVLDDLFDH